MAKKEDSIYVGLSAEDLAEIISNKTGKKCTTKTHWFEVCVECPPELPRLYPIKIRAYKR